MHEKIIKNAAECRLCHDVIESKSVHDFRYCKCGAIFVDGGKEYLRCGGKSFTNIIDRSEVKELSAAQLLVERLDAYKRYHTRPQLDIVRDVLEFAVIASICRALRDNPVLKELAYEKIVEIEKVLKKELVGK